MSKIRVMIFRVSDDDLGKNLECVEEFIKENVEVVISNSFCGYSTHRHGYERFALALTYIEKEKKELG